MGGSSLFINYWTEIGLYILLIDRSVAEVLQIQLNLSLLFCLYVTDVRNAIAITIFILQNFCICLLGPHHPAIWFWQPLDEN